jgi:hypothetical protein
MDERISLMPELEELQRQLKLLENVPPLPPEEQTLIDKLGYFMAKNTLEMETKSNE